MRYVLSFVSLWLLVTLAGCQKESFLEEGEGCLGVRSLSSERNQGCGRFSLE